MMYKRRKGVFFTRKMGENPKKKGLTKRFNRDNIPVLLSDAVQLRAQRQAFLRFKDSDYAGDTHCASGKKLFKKILKKT
ncbi:MAG: hypothetical protein K6G90_13600 [Clostridia bacterium]|nr:hypothetical protein [Clostridia bacterium]